MKTSVKIRLATAAADIFLLSVGTVIAAIVSASGTLPQESYSDAVDVLCIMVLCFLLSIVVVEIVSMFEISDSTVHTVFIASSIFGYCITSKDFAWLIVHKGGTINAEVFDCLNFVFFILVTLSVIFFWDYTYKIPFTKKIWAALGAGSAACAALYCGLSPAGLKEVGFFVYLGVCAATLAGCYVHLYKNGKADLVFYVTEALFCTVCGSAAVNFLCSENIIAFPPSGFTSFYTLIVIFLFAMTYVAFVIRTDREALKASEYKLKYERVRTEALRGQIKPHFIFNSLAAIQSLYYKSTQAGDRATNLFSRHLRANVEAGTTDLIPFEKELDNVQVYVDLENMRFDNKFNVIFDIDPTDFEIPVLSLQPYIENAMRYSKVNEKPDGYIKISSRMDGKDIVLEVSDNGVGFDDSAIKPTSCGIRNSRERFEMLMGVVPEIRSAPGEGTVITILIPADKRSRDEDNNS